MTLEAARGEKFLIRSSSSRQNEEIVFSNFDQSKSKIYYHLIAEARSDTPGGIYPKNTTLVYKYEKMDTYDTFDHEAGTFYAPLDSDYELIFHCQRNCGGEEEKIYIYKNGYPIAKFYCTGSWPLTESVTNYQPLLTNDTYHVYSGSAEILMDETVFKMQVQLSNDAL